MSIWTLVGTIPGAGTIGTVVNWLARTKPATKINTVGRFIIGAPKPATRVAQSPMILKTVEKPATDADRLSFDLSHTSHIITAAVDAGGTGTWTDPSNIQGAPNSQVARYFGSLVLGSSKLRGTVMATQNNRGPLIIDAVYLRFHYEATGMPVVSDLISNLVLGYRINTSPVPTVDFAAATVTANENYLAAGREIRIDNGSGVFTDTVSTAVTWANIALLQPYFGATTIVNGLMAYYADAIRLRVVAHATFT